MNWYIKNNYCNRTIVKQFKMLKSFLRWFPEMAICNKPGVLSSSLS